MNLWPPNSWGANPGWAPGGPDWLWWGSAIAVGLLALWLLHRSLIRDPGRGTRRCPKCWYDMGAIEGRACPECGKQAQRERSMHRTRRRWRLLPLVCALALLGWWGAAMPSVRKHGVMYLVPDRVLGEYVLESDLGAAYSGSDPSRAAHAEFARRVGDGRVSRSYLFSMIRRSGMLRPEPVGHYSLRFGDAGPFWIQSYGYQRLADPISLNLFFEFELDSDLLRDTRVPHYYDRALVVNSCSSVCDTGFSGPFVFRDGVPERMRVHAMAYSGVEPIDLGTFWVSTAFPDR